MGQEFELKYGTTEAQQEAIFAAYGPWQTIRMETTYFDTPGRDLSQRHITLRKRMENGISICTVKTPLPDGARGEWECECDNILNGLQRLCELGAPEFLTKLAQKGLTSVCGARFTRRCCSIVLDGAAVELALDRGLLLGGSKELPLCEVEAELKVGDRAVAIDFAADLATRFGLQPENKSKFRRAMMLAEGE